MLDTTSKLFHRLRAGRAGERALRGAQRAPTCAQLLSRLIEGLGSRPRSGWLPRM